MTQKKNTEFSFDRLLAVEPNIKTGLWLAAQWICKIEHVAKEKTNPGLNLIH